MDFVDAQTIHDAGHVSGQILYQESPSDGWRRITVATHVEANGSPIAGQDGYPGSPPMQVAGRGMVQQNNFAIQPGIGKVVYVVMDLRAVDL
jgi:hypothetical protein